MRCLYRRTVEDYSELTFPPHCPKCPGLLRPDVVLFGEPLSLERLMILFTELDSGFDLVFSIGTSSVFSYIAEPVRMAVQFGRPTVEINPGVSEVSDLVDIKLTMRAAPRLDAIWQAYRQRSLTLAASCCPIANCLGRANLLIGSSRHSGERHLRRSPFRLGTANQDDWRSWRTGFHACTSLASAGLKR